MQKLYFETANEWEKWLAINHKKEPELWLVYYKKNTGKPCIAYDDSVKIALCYGWIDGLVNRIDEKRYARRFTPRKKNSVWSESNKKRVAELLKAGKMKTAGMCLVEAAKQNGKWKRLEEKAEINNKLTVAFKTELKKNPKAGAFFDTLTQSQQKHFIVWINMAKRDATREKRISESIQLLSSGKKLR